MKKIVVIGGGASGIVAAIFAARKGNEVTILEKNESCARKILVTGNGRCNYWNEDQDIKHYKSQNSELVNKFINKTNQDKILEFFNEIGIEPKIKNGYYYPFSNQASSMRDALMSEVKNLNIKIINNINVETIKKIDEKFVILSSEEKIYADRIILACGSKASLKKESEANGYKICESLGLEIVKPLPALVQLRGNEKFFKEWNGVRSDVKIDLYENDEKVLEEIGEIQLTDYGISGICVFNLSSRAIRGLDTSKKEYVKINFLSGLNIQNIGDFINFMNERSNKLKDRNVNELLYGVLNKKLVDVLIKKSQIRNGMYWTNLSDEEKETVARNIVDLRIDITGSNSFDKAQVCSGGVKLTEINNKTMEVNKVKGMYITGELLDVDGDCGGYNLEWAWITGMIAGENI